MNSILYRSPGRLVRRYLPVTIAGQVYGIPDRLVRAVIASRPEAASQWMPEFVEGVTHLSGRLVPVINLRRQYGLASGAERSTAIVVVQAWISDQPAILVGIQVDHVGEVIEAESFETSPATRRSNGALPCYTSICLQDFPILDCDRAAAPLFSAPRPKAAA